MRMSLWYRFVLLLTVAAFALGCTEKHEINTPSADGDIVVDGDQGDIEEEPAPDGDDTEFDVEPDAVDTELPPDAIRIATYNTHLFFDTVCDSGECGYDDFEDQLSLSAYGAKVRDVAESIEILDADIVLVQEIETADCLDDLAEELADRYPVAYLGEIGYDGSIDVGVLADAELVTTVNHRYKRIPLPDGSDTTIFTREFLEVHLDFDGDLVIVFVGHFKAKANDDPDRRLAEAMAAYDIVTQTATDNPDALIVMGGDMNDVPGSAPINTLEQNGDLLRVASELPGNEDGTYWYHGQAQAIDHLFFATGAAGSYISGTAEVVVDYDGAFHLGSSDHAALRANFMLP